MKEQLENELKNLKLAYAFKLVTTNEYCEIYHAISKKLNNLK